MVSLNKDTQDEGMCPFCLESLKEAVSLDCRHLCCRVCLTQYVENALASGVLSCPLCRKPFSEGVLGEGYICHSHQKRVCRFCELSRCLLCVECLKCPEHQSHPELTIENAISHYKERLSRRGRKLRKEIWELQQLKAQEEEMLRALQVDWGDQKLEAELQSQHQTNGKLGALPQQQLDQREDLKADVARILDLSEAIMQFRVLVADLEKMAKELDASTLKDASDLLNRSAPQKFDRFLSLFPSTGPAPHIASSGQRSSGHIPTAVS